MSSIYLNQVSAALLGEALVVLVLVGYLVSLVPKASATRWLAAMSATVLVFMVLLAAVVAMPHADARLPGIPELTYVVFFASIGLLVQFVYRFPYPLAEYAHEARVVLGLSAVAFGLLALWMAAFHLGVAPDVTLGLPLRYYALTGSTLVAVAWAARIVIRGMRDDAHRAESQLVPQRFGRAARTTARLFLAALSSLLTGTVLGVLMVVELVTRATGHLGMVVFGSISLLLFVIGYFYHAPHRVSVTFRLTMASLCINMTVLGLVGFSTYDQLLPIFLLMLGTAVLTLISIPLILLFTLVKPLTGLVSAVQQVNDGDLTPAISVHSDDEVGFLADSFSNMVVSIRLEREALQNANASLEQRIRKRTAELEAARDSAEAANRAKSAFLASMSHELRTPLNAILGFASLLRQRHPEQRQLEIIEESGRHLLLLIEDILDLARIEAGRLELTDRSFALTPLIRQLEDMIRLQAETKGIGFRCHIAPGLPQRVVADEVRLRQVLLNLLTNAVKYTDRGEVTLTIEAATEAEPAADAPLAGARIRFIVEDTGVGISPDDLESIFEPFRQASTLHKPRDGAGLGLAISSRLVELMAGRLHAASQPGEGSRFWFEVALPVAARKELSSPIQRKIVRVAGGSPSALVVDDNRVNRQVLQRMLESLGFSVVTAPGAREGLTEATRTTPDVLLIDLMMPEMDGFEFIRRARKTDDLARVPAVAVSASAFAETKTESLDAGYDDFISKPVDLPTLTSVLERWLSLTWEYADAGADAGADANPDGHKGDGFAVPSPETLEGMLRSARIGDIQALERASAQLRADAPQYDAFVARVETFLRGFKVQDLRRWLENHRAATTTNEDEGT